jgi:DNA-directed RNA polymerase specialized sigma24 family protein
VSITTKRVEGQPAKGCAPAADVLASYRAELYRFACHLTRDCAAADALYRATMLRAFAGWEEFVDAACPRARLFAIATTVYLADRRRGLPGEAPMGRGRPATACGDRPDGEALLREVEAGVAALPRRQWVALVQRWYFDLGYKEIAASLCSSEAEARASVYEALRAMRAHLERGV